jgi:glucose-6-phosphate 1-dehydrogenase
LAEVSQYERLKKHINLKAEEQLVFYLAVPPQAATRIADNLGQAGLTTENVKILFEKPFGIDLTSAQEMVERTRKYFKESQIYRVDHFLAKEMAQNIVAFRSGNALLRHIWNNASIESIEVLALEKVGVEGRAHFYEQVGALRDVLQGHLMQLLALVLMDTPAKLDWSQLPRLRYQALAHLTTADPARARRAQYEGYAQEVSSTTTNVETFVSVELQSDSNNWEGVPLYLATGKSLDRKLTEIKIHFRAANEEQSNCLRLNIQPDEGVEIDLYTKKPGYEREFEIQKLQFKYPKDEVLPGAYEQVLVDAVFSRKSLFTTSEEILESWRVLQPLLDAWAHDPEPIKKYPKGSTYVDLIAG